MPLMESRISCAAFNHPDQTDAHPVTCVSIHDAMAYAEWLSRETGQTYRVPSAAEWQYAARAGSNAAMLFLGRAHDPVPWANVCSHGNFGDPRYSSEDVATCSDGVSETAEVGVFMPNGVGLHDMKGNISELVLACVPASVDRNYSPPLVGPHGPAGPLDGSPERPSSCDYFVAVFGED